MHILHAVHSVTVKGDSIIMLISLLTCRYSMLNSGCKDLILHSLLAVVLPAACSLFITPSLVNPEWHGLISSDRIQRPYILCRTFTNGWHMDVDMIECGSDNCNYPLTSCKSVALRNRLLRRMFNPSFKCARMFGEEIQYWCVLCCGASHACYRHSIRLRARSPIRSEFGIVETQSTEVSFSACSTKHYLHKCCSQ